MIFPMICVWKSEGASLHAGLAVVVESVHVSALVAPGESQRHPMITKNHITRSVFEVLSVYTSCVVVGQHVWPWSHSCA
jgi:hypothetical protein